MQPRPYRKKKPREVAKDITSHNALSGVVESVVFHSEETGYTVCSVKIPDHPDNITVVGNCTVIWVGELLDAQGEWINHKKHGQQFKASQMTCIAPTSTRGIERYLASGMIRGIGKVMAERLVKEFGKRTLEIIEKESKRLEHVDGIGPIRRKRIKESWIEQHAVRDIMIFLQGHGIGAAQSARIYRRYGNKAIDLIRENPYRLCSDVWGIGFQTADSVGKSVGVPVESEMRARSGLIHVLQTMNDEGHCFCPEPELVLQAQGLLDIPTEILGTALVHQLKQGALIKDDGKIYLAALHHAECGVADRLRSIMSAPTSFDPIAVDKAVPWAEEKIELSLAPRQVEALEMALSSKVSIMTGGPGVGKTTIIRALVDVFSMRKLSIAMAAPTGRAAKRMEEATGHEAKTIHRLLKYLPRNDQFEHGPGNPIPADIFILDEVSMVDIRLMHSFLQAIPNHACLILVGDADQLPSVGPGNVLRDTIHSNVIPCTSLDRIFRQETGGWIVSNAHRVNHGEPLELPGESDESADFYFVETQDPDDVIRRLLRLVTDRIPRRFGFDPMNDIQILTPMRKNQLGADNLNVVLQEALNPRGPALQRFGRQYRQGDRVMQIRNNYDKVIFNGDIGRITKVDTDDFSLVVDFEGQAVSYDTNELDELIHAYACSIHKSQGSEYPAVVILMTTQHFKLLQRNLLYTAITRGRHLVCLVGSTKAVSIATRNNEIRARRTGLKDRLKCLQ